MPLNTEPNFSEPGVHHRWAYTPGDAFYDALIAAHHGLSDAQSELLNARLVLLLANHVGDLSLLREAIALARAGVGQTTGVSGPVPGSSVAPGEILR